jgi:hypothetical protein
MTSQMNAVKAERGAADMNAYLRRGYSWTVE